MGSIKYYDLDGDGEINFDEFARWSYDAMRPQESANPSVDPTLRASARRQHAVEWATNIFAAADKNGDGVLTKTEIRKYFKANPEDKYVKANRERPR